MQSMQSMHEWVRLYVAATLAWPSPAVRERNQVTLLTAPLPCLASLMYLGNTTTGRPGALATHSNFAKGPQGAMGRDSTW
jgi:hypothetical protein